MIVKLRLLFVIWRDETLIFSLTHYVTTKVIFSGTQAAALLNAISMLFSDSATGEMPISNKVIS
ncbi:Uncharacterised protein [Yersinia enterocolitica]|nr:Uncharacterised protein [Yersinia enterocolitica]